MCLYPCLVKSGAVTVTQSGSACVEMVHNLLADKGLVFISEILQHNHLPRSLCYDQPVGQGQVTETDLCADDLHASSFTQVFVGETAQMNKNTDGLFLRISSNASVKFCHAKKIYLFN